MKGMCILRTDVAEAVFPLVQNEYYDTSETHQIHCQLIVTIDCRLKIYDYWDNLQRIQNVPTLN